LLTNKTDRQTDKHRRKYNLLGGGNNNNLIYNVHSVQEILNWRRLHDIKWEVNKSVKRILTTVRLSLIIPGAPQTVLMVVCWDDSNSS